MIRIFQRHCNFSSNSANKERPAWFDREKIFDSFKETFTTDVKYTAVFDKGSGNVNDHFISKKDVDIIEIEAGTEAKSFTKILEYVNKQDFDNDDIIYFVEDDYLHRQGWVNILIEGVQNIGAEYFTLYDHPDKYYLQMYDNLQSKIICTQSTYWRTTPSTTCTFACKFSTLQTRFKTHIQYCSGEYTRDHDMFTELWSIGSNLISCMPAYSTHVEANMLSPFINWETECR